MPIFGSFTGARMFGKGGGGGQMQASSSGNNQTPTNGLEPGNGYVYHTFSGPGTFTVEESGQAEIMVLGGGGGGAGHAASGGGGAGGMAVAHEQPLAIGSYTITVGAGGGSVHHSSYLIVALILALVVMVLLSLDKVAVALVPMVKESQVDVLAALLDIHLGMVVKHPKQFGEQQTTQHTRKILEHMVVTVGMVISTVVVVVVALNNLEKMLLVNLEWVMVAMECNGHNLMVL